MQVVLDVAEFGHDTEAVVHHLMTGEHAVKLHDRHLLTSDELDLMDKILGVRKSIVQSRPCILADALQKRAVVGARGRTKTGM